MKITKHLVDFWLRVGLVLTACGALGLPLASAKLPAPSDEAKARSAEAAARTAHGNKVADFQLCKSRERVAAHFFKTVKASGKDAPTPVETASCVDPGPFVPATAAAPPAASPAAAAGAAPAAPAKKAS